MTRGMKLSRRGFLSSILAAAGLAAVRCGGDGEEMERTPQATASEDAGEPRRGGVIHLAQTAPAISLDPHAEISLDVTDYTYGDLVHATDWGGTVADLAESWEVVDELDWIFSIRQGVLFHDLPPANGRELVAEDFTYSFQRVESIPGATLTGWNEWIDRYEAPDARTFSVHTKKPYAYIMYSLGNGRMAAVPREAVEQFGDLESNVIGTGPFMLKSHDLSGGVEIERYPDYYRPDIPYVDGIKWQVLPDDAAIQAAFRSGLVDVYGAPDKLRAESVSSRSGVSVHRFLNRMYAVLALNAAAVPAFADQRVREAVDLSLDRQDMIDKLTLGDGELAGPVPPSWDTALPPEEIREAYKRDVAKAKQLLQAAGAEGLQFRLSCASYEDNPDRAAIIKENLEEVGIRADLEVKELGAWLADLFAVNFQATTYAHLPYLSDDIQLQAHHTQGFTRAMFLGITDTEMDSLLEQIQTTIDDEERRELARETQRRILERHGPTLVLYEPYGYFVAYDYVKNYKPSPFSGGLGLFRYDMWLDKG